MSGTGDAVLLSRRRWLLRGQVQGVGFRPWAFRLARRYQLAGYVRNDVIGLTIEAQGRPSQLDLFEQAMQRDQPELAVVDHLSKWELPATADDTEFRIQESEPSWEHEDAGLAIGPDTAMCGDCRRELFADADRRTDHALINCTNCGPRFSIVRRGPYDRPNTTMADFALCQACAREYRDPGDRRFHAQAISCPDCGPQMALVNPKGAALPGEPIAQAVALLQHGHIVAIKGLGGFHLAVRADDQAAVERLRQLKGREAKPFALMAASLEEAQRLAHLSAAAVALMQSPVCPIILAQRRADAQIAPVVATGTHRLGVMLPYTPMQHLLFKDGPAVLVMTSGNLSDEPLAIDNAEAVSRLGPLCDAILWHDRPIQRAVDDSIFIDLGEGDPLPIRRARGLVPSRVMLPGAEGMGGGDGLCVGGELKNTLAVVREGQAILSQHLGDLTHPLAFDHFRQAAEDTQDLFGVEPKWIAHDLHPQYLSTGFAREIARQRGIPLIGVQHHHAHAAAVMAEHGRRTPTLAIVCDGVGFGLDGTVWGGELLLADLIDFKRLARLRPISLPGGDAAARDTRRCGLALLVAAFGNDFDEHPAAVKMIPDASERQMLAAMICRDVQCVRSSSAGRVFDGVAALLGLYTYNEFEAQAAMALEAAASEVPSDGVDADAPSFTKWIDRGSAEPAEIDLGPLVREILRQQERGKPVAETAALFHNQLARAWQAAALCAAEATGIDTVALSGGVFCNQILTERLTDGLSRHGLHVLRHRLVPPNDGGLALGQAAVAAARVRVERKGV